MKRIGVVAFVVAVLSAAAFGLTYRKAPKTTPTVSAEIEIIIDRPNSITYMGDNRLIIADQQGIKQFDILTQKVTPLFQTDDGAVSFGPSGSGFAITKNIVFHKETNTLYMQDENSHDTVYAYNENAIPQYRTLTKAEVDAILYSEDELALGRSISDTRNNEDITDIIGQTMADVHFAPAYSYFDITVDKYNRTIWYINNSLYSYPTIIDEEIRAWWSFDDYQDDHYQWQTTDAIESGDNLFANAEPNTFIYQYPSAETPRVLPTAIPTGRNTVIMLNGANAPVFGDENETEPGLQSFDYWRFVLYETGIGEYKTGYVSAKKLKLIADYQIEDLADDPRAKSVVKFKPKTPGMSEFIGRVIRYVVPVYKYPTCIINTLTVGEVKRTEYTGNNSLPLQNLITITDTLNWHYFQIEVKNADGDVVGVGFVPTNPIIDILAEPEYKRIIPNAEIVADSAETITIYKDAEGKEPLTEITLKNGAEIRIVTDKKDDNRYRRTATYNKIYYNDPEIGAWWMIEGYVETKYIKPQQSSLSPAQWIGLSMLGVVLVGGLAAFIIVSVSNANYEKRKREMNALPPDEPEVTA